MATKEFNLPIERREKTGTTGSNALRAAGKIPGVLYGHGDAPQHVTFEAKTFDELLHRGARTGIITLTENGKKADTALVRDVQRHPVTQRIIHADLQRVSLTESIHAKLPVVTVGVAKGVRDAGGVLDVITHELEVQGPANAFPENIEVDVTELGIHGHVNAADIKLPKGFKMLTPGETTVVVIEASRTAQALEEAAAGTLQAEPEVIGAKPEATA